MTTWADPPANAITYVQWLQGEIADRMRGVQTVCGPPIADWPTLWERILGTRPNAELERKLERQLRELDHQARAQAHAEAQAG
jgi:hypothetical protein